ncbi:MAG: primosomal protein N' [Flavobacteriaceae bacterium]
MKMEEPEVPFAFIDVILPLALPKAYTYTITEDHYDQLAPGFRVAVPFGKQKVYTAVVIRVHRVAPQTYGPKSIVMILDKIAMVTPIQLEFWEWMARYYMCSMGDIMRASLPAALLIESQTILTRNELEPPEMETLTDDQFLVFEALQKQTLSLEEISQITDQKKVMPLVLDMLEKGAALIYQKIEEKFKPKRVRYIRLSPPFQEEQNLESLFESLKNAPKQSALVMGFLSDSNSLDSWQKVSDFKQKTQASSSQIRTLLDKAVFEEIFQEENRVLIRQQRERNSEKVLSPAQQKALVEIQTVFKKKEVILFEGVTASGKTELYIKLIEEQLSKGKQILYLLPEISLTSQIVTRLATHFGNQVSVYHSKYSIHERTEVWQRTLEGSSQGQIIVGARSAVLLPFQDLGLVIIDEEHENSYKQFDPAPRYQARDSAIFLARRMNAKVLLGSATPSLETAENVRTSKYGWVKLSERYGGVSLPIVELIDLKDANRRKTMNGMFSKTLIHSIQKTLDQKKQVILFQNRRGYAPISECLSCGHTPQCSQCDVSLTYHQTKNQLKCHYCGYSIPMPSQCHACGMPTLTTKGVGTKQIE